MNTQDAIKKHIYSHLEQHGISLADLCRAMGVDRRYLSNLNKQGRNIGVVMFRKVAKVVKFPAWLEPALVEQAGRAKIAKYEAISRKRAGNAWGNDRQPWPVTVAKLKAEKPVYARAW